MSPRSFPAVVPGAGRSKGLELLRHVERCSALVHVLNTVTPESGRAPLSGADILEEELQQDGGPDDRPRVVALNKIDPPDGKDPAERGRPAARRRRDRQAAHGEAERGYGGLAPFRAHMKSLWSFSQKDSTGTLSGM